MKNIEDFLKDPGNSVVREKLVNYQFFYEVKRAAVHNFCNIQLSIPEVDKDGYDVVLDDGIRLKPFQLKAMVNSSKTEKWEVQKNLLRPSFLNCERFNFEASPDGEGVEGGFILVEIMVESNEIKNFNYFYTDIFVQSAFEIGILSRKSKAENDRIQALRDELRTGKRNEKVKLTRGNLVKVKSVEHLLALADMHSRFDRRWQSNLLTAIESALLRNAVDQTLQNDIAKRLEDLIDDPKVVISSNAWQGIQ